MTLLSPVKDDRHAEEHRDDAAADAADDGVNAPDDGANDDADGEGSNKKAENL